MTAPHDPKRVVADGYDRIAERYAAWAAGVRIRERDHYTNLLLDRVPEGAAVLELGCGAGVPTTRRLAERFAVTGVDISTRQIALARRNVPRAVSICGDMTALEFAPRSFDAVCAFYAITHVPREEHAALLGAIAGWLKPNGLLVASFSNGGTAGEIEGDWLGAPMYFSGYDARQTRVSCAKRASPSSPPVRRPMRSSGSQRLFSGLWRVKRLERRRRHST